MESGGGVYQSTPASKVPSRWEHRERLSPRVQDVQMFVCGSLRLASLCSNVNININAVKRRWTAAPAPWPKQEPGGCEGGKTRRSMMMMMTNAEVYIIQAASGWAGRQGSGKENTQHCDEGKKKKKAILPVEQQFSACAAASQQWLKRSVSCVFAGNWLISHVHEALLFGTVCTSGEETICLQFKKWPHGGDRMLLTGWDQDI